MTLKNTEIADAGLRLHQIATDRFKMSRLSFNFILPADRKRSVVTKLMLAVMMRGCRRYPSVIQINRRLDELYGATVSWRATTVGERHIFKISCEMLSNKYRLPGDLESVACGVCELVTDILLDPLTDENGLLSETIFESEKKLAIDAIRAKINDQRYYASEQCKNVMFEGSPAGISVDGNEEDVKAVTLKEISENIPRFLRDSVLECYYIGSDSIEDVSDLIAKRFSAIGRESRELEGKEIAFVREGSMIRQKEDSMNVTQSRLYLGYTGGVVLGDRDYYAMSLFNEIFGGSSVGKLFLNVREKKSLCYYCSSSFSSATGTVMVGCGIKKENRDQAFSEIAKQLGEMQKGRITREEIETAKRTIVSGLQQISDSPSAMEAFRFRRYLASIEENPEDCIAKIMAVNKDEIVSMAKRIRLDTVYFLCGTGEEEVEDYE